MKKSENTRSIGAAIPSELHRKLRFFSVDKDVSIAEILAGLIEIMLDDNPLGEKLRDRIVEGGR